MSFQTMDQVSFWQGDDIICWSRDYLGFQHFPALTISLAAAANETINLVVSPRQYLRLVSDRELYSVQFSTDSQQDCFRVSISPSDTGLYFSFIARLYYLCENMITQETK